MVKGTSRQVIMVQAPETKLFEQAIFILKEDAIGEGISDEALLKEAQKAEKEALKKMESLGEKQGEDNGKKKGRSR